MDISRLVAQLKKDEGFRPTAYWDNRQWTIGFGCKANGPNDTITMADAENLLRNRVQVAIFEFSQSFHDVDTINDVREEVLVTLIFNMGRHGVEGFPDMNKAIREGDWEKAADELMDSKWYKKDLKGNERARRLVMELRNGNPVATL